jgi:FkbM family methyltransferase
MPRHPFKSLALYVEIFGILGFYYAVLAFVTRRKKIVRVATRWAPQHVYVRLNSSDINVFKQVFIEREYQLIEKIPERLDVVVDAGANIGLTSIFIATRHTDARIYALEPESGNFELLQKNTAAFRQIHCIRGALWGRDESVQIISPDAQDWAFRVGGRSSADSALVSGYRVGSLASTHDESRISLLKMDIEGAELDVLKDADGWIGMVDNIVIELHERISPGCTALFEQVTNEFVTLGTSTELTLVSRKEARTSPQ